MRKKISKIKIVFTLFAAGCFLLSNCWYYSFKGNLPPHIKTIAIPLFVNKTAEFGLQEDITDGVQDGFLKENILRITDEKNADSILYGTILSVNDAPITYTESKTGEFVQEYRITITTSIEWFDKVNNKAIIKKNFTGFSEYDPTGASEATREIAIREAVENITEDIINSIISSGW